MSFFNEPKFGITRKNNEARISKNSGNDDIINKIKTYMMYTSNGNVLEGMGLLEKIFPSQEQRALREQQAQAIYDGGQAQRRMMKVLYDSVSSEIEQAARSRYEIAQVRHDAAFAEEQLRLIKKLYGDAKPQLKEAVDHLLDGLEQIERLPEEYRVQSKMFVDEMYYSQLAQVITTVRMFKERTEALCA
ncbi:hypothetical protein I8752_10650 [Nostocaceae cyanobacterium CENA369]|uniref:Uncharacterized protein n=1 Tax=Dendronalium phyllosphericum CENA369 TaxID=1725256 RepID=A0A8J7I0A7_9NOST|nr:hypothetical protein [Dendronalium phyllosphericum]MBH8573466.1 hypothetical protein [Dendronalium phyllosphericum CENA369]